MTISSKFFQDTIRSGRTRIQTWQHSVNEKKPAIFKQQPEACPASAAVKPQTYGFEKMLKNLHRNMLMNLNITL